MQYALIDLCTTHIPYRNDISDVIRLLDKQMQRWSVLRRREEMRRTGLTLLSAAGNTASYVPLALEVYRGKGGDQYLGLDVLPFTRKAGGGGGPPSLSQASRSLSLDEHHVDLKDDIKEVPRASLNSVSKATSLKMAQIMSETSPAPVPPPPAANVPASLPGPASSAVRRSSSFLVRAKSVFELEQDLAVNPSALPSAEKFITTLSTKGNLKYMHVGDQGAALLAQALKGDHIITRLTLSAARIGSSGIQAIGRAMPFMHALTYLDLSQNCIEDGVVVELAQGLKRSHSLQRINLAANRISDSGARMLVRTALRKISPAVTYLKCVCSLFLQNI